MQSKPWYTSKVLWVNVLACVAMIVEAITGQEWLDVEAQVGILAVINLVLRIITNQGLSK